MRYLTQWFKRYFSDPEVVFLTIFLLISFAVVLTMGHMLAPVLASLVIAYLLEGLVGMIERKKIPRFAAVLLVYLVFLLFVTLLLLTWLVWLRWRPPRRELSTKAPLASDLLKMMKT